MTENQKEQIASMRLAGASYAAIAATLGLSRNTVKSYCLRNVAVEPYPINLMITARCAVIQLGRRPATERVVSVRMPAGWRGGMHAGT